MLVATRIDSNLSAPIPPRILWRLTLLVVASATWMAATMGLWTATSNGIRTKTTTAVPLFIKVLCHSQRPGPTRHSICATKSATSGNCSQATASTERKYAAHSLVCLVTSQANRRQKYGFPQIKSSTGKNENTISDSMGPENDGSGHGEPPHHIQLQRSNNAPGRTNQSTHASHRTHQCSTSQRIAPGQQFFLNLLATWTFYDNLTKEHGQGGENHVNLGHLMGILTNRL
jgi:hypothetical protein